MIQYIEPSQRERHRHQTGYAAFVLSGRYEETGDTGRWRVEAGDIVYHRPYEAHCNLIQTSCAVINIPVPPFVNLPSVFSVAQADDLLSVVQQGEAWTHTLLIPHTTKRPMIKDWPDRLALDLQNAPVSLRQWATENGLQAETVSRGFKRAYGVTPAQYRIAAQTRFALDAILHNQSSLADIAIETGFSDQAHLSRAVKTLTGQSPAAWRRVNSVQDAQAGCA